MGKTEIDGDAADFFFREAVGFDAGQPTDQSGFAMIDMAGRANQDVFEISGRHLGCDRLGVNPNWHRRFRFRWSSGL